jgi:hypothetical protein
MVPQELTPFLPEFLHKLPFYIQIFILGFVALHVSGILVLLFMHFANSQAKSQKAKYT